MSNSTGAMPAPTVRPLRIRYLVFAAIAAMAAYVLYHNERFLIDATAPVWNHYDPFKWWLLPHGLAGACALVLAPMQFAEGFRRRHTTVHRTMGTLYRHRLLHPRAAGALHPVSRRSPGRGAVLYRRDHDRGRQSLMITTGFGLYFALTRQFTYHRQWMIRSYAVALTFLEIRVIMGVFGLDQPFDWHVPETVVWSCVASSVLIGDIANQFYESHLRRRRAAVGPVGRSTAVAGA